MESNAFFLEKMSKKSVESRGDTDVQIVRYIPLSLFPLSVAEVEQLYQVKRMIGGIGNNTTEDEREERREKERERKREKREERKREERREREKEKKERDRRERESPPVCAFKTPALRVYVQNVSVCTGTTRTCVSTCARGAGTVLFRGRRKWSLRNCELFYQARC